MKNEQKAQKVTTKPLPLGGSRQVVESSIDATKALRNRTWDASARGSRIAQKKRSAKVKMASCVE